MAPADTHDLGPLLERSRAGDLAAREDLFARLRPFLKAMLHSWLGSGSGRQLVDSDIVQTALLKVHRDFAQCRGRSVPEFLGWVRQIAAHTALDDRRRSRAWEQELDHDQAAVAELPPLEKIEKAEEALRLAAALEQLSERRRDVVMARLFQGLSFESLASRDGTKAGTLRVLFLRALRQLRQILESDHAPP